MLGTTRDFLDYFSLKKLDDLPTLAQLKELEDLRVQLTLPGAGPEVATPAAGGGEAAPEAGAEDDEDQTLRAQDADGESPRAQGLVARGAQDDSGN